MGVHIALKLEMQAVLANAHAASDLLDAKKPSQQCVSCRVQSMQSVSLLVIELGLLNCMSAQNTEAVYFPVVEAPQGERKGSQVQTRPVEDASLNTVS